MTMNIIEHKPMLYETYRASITFNDLTLAVTMDGLDDAVGIKILAGASYQSLTFSPADARLIAQMLIDAANKATKEPA
jgi:hypothetical protein